MSASDVTLGDALEDIQSTSVESRKRGMVNLRHVLEANKQSNDLQAVRREKHIFPIFEAITRAVKKELSTYNTATKPTIRAGAASRLATCASTLRYAIGVLLTRLRVKSLRLLLAHVADSLLDSTGVICGPIVDDYIRAFASLLSFAPHVEHLLEGEWCDIVDFCTSILSKLRAEDEDAEESSSSFSSSRAPRAMTALTTSMSRPRRSMETQANINAIVASLAFLTAASNAPVLQRASQLLECLSSHLKKSNSANEAQVASLEALATVVDRVSLDSETLVSRYLKDCISILQSAWQWKGGFRDKAVILMLCLQPYIAAALSTNQDDEIGMAVDELYEEMKAEFFRMEQRDKKRLTHDHLHPFSSSERLTWRPFAKSSFRLRRGVTDIEYSYAQLDIIGFFLSQLDKLYTQNTNHDDNHQPNARKRRRVVSKVEELLQQASTGFRSDRSSALQILAFTLDHMEVRQETVDQIIEVLLASASDSNGDLASWSLICLSELSTKLAKDNATFRSKWLAAWSISSKLITSQAHCSAACHLMYTLIVQGAIDKAVSAETLSHMMNSASLQGPALVCDQSCMLWAELASTHLFGGPFRPNDQYQTSIIGWLAAKWKPTSTENKANTLTLANSLTPIYILSMLQPGQSISHQNSASRDFTHYGEIGRLICARKASTSLMQYLFQPQACSIPGTTHAEEPPGSRAEVVTKISWSLRIEEQLLDYIENETNIFRDAFQASGDDGAQSLSLDGRKSMSAFCIACLAIFENFSSVSSRKQADIQMALLGFFKLLLPDSTKGLDEEEILTSIHMQVMDFMPRVSKDFALKSLYNIPHSLKVVCTELYAVTSRVISLEVEADGSDTEGMDLDTSLSTSRTLDRSTILPRTSAELRNGSKGFLASSSAYAHLIGVYADVTDKDDEKTEQVMDNFVEDLISIPSEGFFLSARFIQSFICSAVPLSSFGASSLIMHYSQFIELYEHERSESSLELGIDLMESFVNIWTDQSSEEEVVRIGGLLYSWYIEAGIENHASSPAVACRFSDLLYVLLRSFPDYGTSLSKPSVRTTLFQILQSSNLLVKDHIISRLPEIFSMFVIDQHEKIFEDIQDHLPRDADWAEGIAIRLLAVSHIASRWHSLLRRCIYAIFEIAGQMKNMSNHGLHCIGRIAAALKITENELFQLFKPQLLYTWLQNASVRDVPYGIFGFSSLDACLQDCQDELIAQLIMIGLDDDLEYVEQSLGKPAKVLAQESFALAAAYAFCRDASSRGTDTTQARLVENRLRSLVGEKSFFTLMHVHLMPIVGHLFRRIDGDALTEKTVQSRPSYESASQAARQIIQLSGTDYDVGYSQQPSFRGRYVIEELERISRRVNVSTVELWTPHLVSGVARMLLSDLHPALGSLHVHKTMRKLRNMVAFSYFRVNSGYPLIQLLHALQPLTADSIAAEESIGLFQYLLEVGRSTLRSQSPFFMATITCTILNLQRFLKSPHDSMTQESQKQAIKARVSSFKEWIVTYLETYQAEGIHKMTAELMERLVSALRTQSSIEATGDGSFEFELLKIVLRDMNSRHPIFTDALRDIVVDALNPSLSLLLTDSPVTPAVVTGQGFASQLWRLAQQSNLTPSFQRLAAMSIGREFASTGTMMEALMQESKFRTFTDLAALVKDESTGSKVAILKSIISLLYSIVPRQVELAEAALQHMLAASEKKKDYIVGDVLPPMLLDAFIPVHKPPQPDSGKASALRSDVGSLIRSYSAKFSDLWIQDVCIAMAADTTSEPILQYLVPILQNTRSISANVFPYILHMYLVNTAPPFSASSTKISAAFEACLLDESEDFTKHRCLIINAYLSLRSRPLPEETTYFHRNHWLAIDPLILSSAACSCKMFKSATLLMDIYWTDTTPQSEMSSALANPASDLNQLLLAISESLDEPDMFYGVNQSSTLENIARRMDHEGTGTEALLLLGSQLDSLVVSGKSPNELMSNAILPSLSRLNLNSVVSQLTDSLPGQKNGLAKGAIDAAIKLQKWDVTTQSHDTSNAGTVYQVLQSIRGSTDISSVRLCLDRNVSRLFELMKSSSTDVVALKDRLATLAALTEIDETIQVRHPKDLDNITSKWSARAEWMQTASIENVQRILSTRVAMTSLTAELKHVQGWLHVNPKIARKQHSQAVLLASSVYRDQVALQEALGCVTMLSSDLDKCAAIGLDVAAAVNFETAKVLWDRGEIAPSTKMLKEILDSYSLESASIEVGRAGLLARLGHQISQGRLEKPDDIMTKYLNPALDCLEGVILGKEACAVYHEFANYCHSQLIQPEFVSEMKRSERFQRRKQKELKDLKVLMKSSDISEASKKEAKRDYGRSAAWLKLDVAEYNRLKSMRQQLLQQSLENYLLSLAAADDHDTDILKFLSLWLENASDPNASKVVAKRLASVPTRKFAPLMNQLASRLQNKSDEFHDTMSSLVERICQDHPYHGMYHIFAGCKTTGGNDPNARSRNAAAEKLAQKLQKGSKTSKIWASVYRSCDLYIKLAASKTDEMKAGAKLKFARYSVGQTIEKEIAGLAVPPITLSIELRGDLNYQDLPKITRFSSQMSIAGGLSAPKIVTAYGTDGTAFKQLYKAGSDDLRQDAIMEQVFEQGSRVLRQNKATRQRNLKIRTYKVIPLTATAGVIEFVDNTMSLNDYLQGAHERYHPYELKWNACRKKIQSAERLEHKARLEIYQDVTLEFHPVLRHFFFERFMDPERWFGARLAYTRSSAAISILGHILGLGDRHCQNILLDARTGEVVHIDLGVAFEAGRILNVPEVVPFRLTRDIVDGFGIMGTEGVFRRCCEFTLEALRQNKDVIMTVLNVLRYDPLYQWSMSPLKAKRLQDEQDKDPGDDGVASSMTVSRTRKGAAAAAAAAVDEDAMSEGRNGDGDAGRDDDEGGEADRALSAVERKLRMGMSVTATVNELIQQATDEQNLAVLFCGWAAYA